MKYCTNCGNQIEDGMAFCTQCGKAVVQDPVNNVPAQMYEEFVPTWGLGKRFVFTENSLIFGKDEYAYSKLSPIILMTAATPVTNGVAQTTTDNGITLTLAYNHKDNERLGAALTYANEQIDIAHGKTKNYKYLLQSPSGSKIEVYDDYIVLYYIKLSSAKGSESVAAVGKSFGLTGKGLTGKLTSGLGKALDSVGNVATSLSNTTKGGATGNIIMFSDLNIRIDADNLIVNEYSIPIGSNNMDLAKEIISYIQTTLESAKTSPKEPILEQELWEPLKGEARTFPLYGKVLEVSQNLDLFNSYRLKFKELAKKCTNRAEAEYKTKIRDFISFIEFFPKIYSENIAPIIQRAVDVLVSEEIWTITPEAFFEQHISDFHLAIDDYNVILESANLTIQKNQQTAAGIMSFVPNLVGGGFGIKGALKGIAIAGTFNAVRDGIENSAVKNATNISPAQQAELYGRIKPDVLINRVFADYWNVYHSLVWTLNQNGHEIWWQTKDVDQKAKNIFKNLSNPNFPQDKVLDALIALLELNPYSPEYYEFAISRFGPSEEITRIKEFFGYED